MNRLIVAAVWLGAFAWLPAAWANLELEALINEAFANNPAVQAAHFEVSRAQAERDELGGFFDPQLNAAASQADYNAGYNQTLLHAGVDAAVLPGVYIGTRVEESYYSQLQDSTVTNVFGSYNNLWQSTAGLRLGMPLLRDRGFLQWKLSDERAAKRHRMAQNHWRAATQQCRHDVEQQYIAVLEAVAQRYVAQAALTRVEKLLKEAQELVQLKIVPGYQLFAARSEVALRREAETAEQQACRTTQTRLLEVLGTSKPVRPVQASFDTLILWAESVDLPPFYSEDTALKARGDYNEILDFIEVAEKEKAINQDKLRDDLALNMEAVLQGEDPDNVIGSGRYLSERNLGASVGLTWKRPWGYRTEKARMRAIGATIEAQHELLRQTSIRVRADLKVQHEQFMSAQDRLSLVSQAIVAARQALEAENERFCLGEGRSRNVLDAQKDLTDALKRQIVIAVELLRAYSNFLYASGYAGEFLVRFFSRENRIMRSLKQLFKLGENPEEEIHQPALESLVLPNQQRDLLERDITILEDEYGEKAKRLHEEAEKQVQGAAEDSVKDLHVIQMGMCPRCGEHLSEHLFATICKACGWNTFEVPQRGPVRVHLRENNVPIEGEHCYVLTTGDVFIIRNDVVSAKVPRDAVSWIEYVWTEAEIAQRYQQVVDRLKIKCGWCEGEADPNKDGFSLVQVAFGSSQERYVFCSTACYEAFRKMYPSRVHRNCYETKCSECNLCTKRYDDETDGIRMIAKDFLKIKNLKK